MAQPPHRAWPQQKRRIDHPEASAGTASEELQFSPVQVSCTLKALVGARFDRLRWPSAATGVEGGAKRIGPGVGS